TMSGVVGAFRKSALMDVGFYSSEMATEDIDMTWKLQKYFYDVRYEPRALVWMQVPSSILGLFKQRLRWAKGLAQVLKRHQGAVRTWRRRRLWAVMLESSLAIAWAYCVVILTMIWVASYMVGYPPVGVSPIPNWWGMLIGTTCILQLLFGVMLERRYDPSVPRYFYVAIFYPILYWMFMALVTVIATPMGFGSRLKRGTVTRWKTARESSS
ncbi:MAG: N-glycosyltransferase, partial [Candidatus Eisenbacteria bacterium]|nr:N-glycosyltransferase [Candidatus Eisenbacteria bacterium]